MTALPRKKLRKRRKRYVLYNIYLHVRAYYKWTKYFDLIGGLYMHAFMHAEVGVFSLLLLLLQSTFVPSHTYYYGRSCEGIANCHSSFIHPGFSSVLLEVSNYMKSCILKQYYLFLHFYQQK